MYAPHLPSSCYEHMISGATGLPKSSIVTRITDVASLPSGVVQLTNVFTDASKHVD
jgi:hypothetical protein